MLAEEVNPPKGWTMLKLRNDTHVYIRILPDGVSVIRAKRLASNKWKIFDPLITSLNFSGVMETPKGANPFDYVESLLG